MAKVRPSRRYTIAAAGLLLALAVALLAPSRSSAAHEEYYKDRSGFGVAEVSIQATAPNQLNNEIYAQCPTGKFPYGGSLGAIPLPGSDGQGAFPLGVERRGGARDVHFIFYDFAPSGTFTPRTVTGQAICGPKPFKLVPVQTIVQVDPGQNKTLVSTCPPGRTLIGGNFARTFFTPSGGDFVTQSRGDIANNSWVVSASAYGSFGGPVVDTAFCAKFRQAQSLGHLIELAAEAGLDSHTTGAATPAACPAGTRFVFGGFSTNPPGSVEFAGGALYNGQSYTGYGFNRSTSRATFSYYSYCLPNKAFKKSKKPRKKP
jgi:hypothetical protein